MTRILDDGDVQAFPPEAAVAVMRDALLAHGRGTLVAPARARVGLGGGELVVTAGSFTGSYHGCRIYDSHPDGDQVVAVWDSRSGRLVALAHGRRLGPLRTGAIGGLAAQTLARPESSVLGVVGTGEQAWEQVRCLTRALPLRSVLVHSRNPDSREAFAGRVESELGLRAEAVPTSREAVEPCDVLVVATSSGTPVLRSDWIRPGTHINAVGPKLRTAHELPGELFGRAQVLVTDSPAQASHASGKLIVPASALAGLGAVLSGREPGRTGADQISIFCSLGLAGTEVRLALALAVHDRSRSDLPSLSTGSTR